MSLNSPTPRPRLSMTIGGILFMVAAAALVASVFSSRSDTQTKKTIDETRERVLPVLKDTESSNDTDEPLQKAKPLQVIVKQIEDLEKLPHRKPLDIPTARVSARNGDIEGAKFLVNYFDKRQADVLNSTESKKSEDDILQELGISKTELTLFRNADE